jgi:hypothetical protein
MKHFATEKWIDFVNQLVTGDEKTSMEKHLAQGCKRCQKTVSLWQRVRQMAATEESYQPPNDTVRVSKASFSNPGLAQQKEGVADRVKVLFDSFLQPVFAGTRSAGVNSRQMLYRADPYQIDIQIEAKPGGGMVVSGQLLNLSKPEIMARDTRVLLSNMRGQSVHTVSNGFGEFSGEIANSGDLQMTITSPGGEPIVISLREALGRASRQNCD